MHFFTPPRHPARDADRLACLRGLNLLDTAPDPVLDDLVARAAEVYAAPIALISLIDAQRQWFKARVGLDAAETPRALSFCAHAIHGAEPFIILDSRQDERFAGNPLVRGAPHVIFYVGVPLRTADGHAIGTLCVIDTSPRGQVTAEQLAQHHWLAAAAMRRIEAAAPRQRAA